MKKNLQTFILIVLFLGLGWRAFPQNADTLKNNGITNKNTEFNRENYYGMEFAIPQSRADSVNKDSLAAKLNAIKRYNDSLLLIIKNYNIAIRSDSLQQLYNMAIYKPGKNYRSWYFAIGKGYSDISLLNNSLSLAGMPTLHNNHIDYTYVFAFTRKRNRYVRDLYMGFLSGRKDKFQNIKFGYQAINWLNYFIGYSVINRKKIDIYPFAGLNLMSTSLYFDNTYSVHPPKDLPSFDSLITFAKRSNEGSYLTFSKDELKFQYGLQLDWHFGYSERETGIILGLRAGRTMPFWTNGWRLDGNSYNYMPDVSLRMYYINFVLKIYVRPESKDAVIVDYRQSEVLQ